MAPSTPDSLARRLRSLSVNTETPPSGRCHASSTPSPAPGCACAICLSPVKKVSEAHTTKCCHQRFHRECLLRYKVQTSADHSLACPLCRSTVATGLTPVRPAAGGFVSAGNIHEAMLRRVAAARNAVQRRISSGTDGGPAATFISPGRAYLDVRDAAMRGAPPRA